MILLTEMKNIVVDFGPVRAVNHVDFSVQPGVIIGLMGENGAGKTTLMNVLAGTFLPTEGEVFLDGKKIHFANSMDAMKKGIRFIHQEVNLCNDLKVYENMFLAEELFTKFGLLDKKTMVNRCDEIFKRMQVNINPNEITGHLHAAEKQLVEIARALLFKADLIIMDEPTTALTTHDIDRLFEIMRQLKTEDVSFIYISHKMPELFAVCDKYFVMRDGSYVAEGLYADVNEQQITELMIGRNLADEEFELKPYYGTEEIALSVKDLCAEDFANISFDLHKGEILAITGLQGSGRESLADALFGAAECSGVVLINERKINPNAPIIEHMKRGIAMVPRARKERGIHTDLSILDNMSMAFLNTKFRGLLISGRAEAERYQRQKAALQIKADNPANLITSLSGGNQQKVILGKWLEADSDIIIFDNPTQGIDVGTKFEIYRLIIELAKNGKAVIVFSSEYAEIRKVADSCFVMYKGEISKILERREITDMNIMYYSTGANLEAICNE